MSLLAQLSDRAGWEKFYEYKTSLATPKQFARELREFIDREGYLAACERIELGLPPNHPRKCVLSKLGTSKKRTVYIYRDDENLVMKLLTYLILRKYDGALCGNLYSFRPGVSAKDAIRRLTGIPGIRGMYSYKVDIHNYFNSVPVERLLPILGEVICDDPELLAYLEECLRDPWVVDGGKLVREAKGIMAGTPLSSFFANVYLRALDRHFREQRVPYARYSDDIIVFAPTREEAEAHAAYIRGFLTEMGLEVNPAKEAFSSPAEGWTFLGFYVNNSAIDIAPATVRKLKGKMRRKARALVRWRLRGGYSGEQAGAAFIRIFNRKLLEGPKLGGNAGADEADKPRAASGGTNGADKAHSTADEPNNAGTLSVNTRTAEPDDERFAEAARDNELTWSFWFFSVINTDASLREIDRYAQECLRYIVSGRRTKARYNVRYDDLRRLGYRNLVHAFWEFKADAARRDAEGAE